ncbi:hypothetical protein QNN03_08765 [Streptomyces sp. GXMU-J15]|uniref:DUF1877 family protein n=1 Tax=Streptomyces fuscus TaxID=3048495 RepID=A0ABT7IWK6_9ACTN|nr:MULTISPECIES: hypothetical protein [Streptomyces]MDL2076526.1 hypothetical protein [Streptomyces fuscus]SBT92709.1 hypothetical protein GA0115233_104944 [Streptomyces sp. DI166]
MGLDITVIIADPSPFTPFPPQKRLSHLRATLLADDTGLWGIDAPCVEEGWVWPEGANSDRFALYEFPGTLGSYKPHFWAGERWDEVREQVDPPLRDDLDALLDGLLGPEDRCTDADLFGEPSPGVLLARSPERVRELAAVWERVRPQLHRVREPFGRASFPDTGWITTYDEFASLLTGWGHVLAEGERRGWCVVGLSG